MLAFNYKPPQVNKSVVLGSKQFGEVADENSKAGCGNLNDFYN